MHQLKLINCLNTTNWLRWSKFFLTTSGFYDPNSNKIKMFHCFSMEQCVKCATFPALITLQNLQKLLAKFEPLFDIMSFIMNFEWYRSCNIFGLTLFSRWTSLKAFQILYRIRIIGRLGVSIIIAIIEINWKNLQLLNESHPRVFQTITLSFFIAF